MTPDVQTASTWPAAVSDLPGQSLSSWSSAAVGMLLPSGLYDRGSAKLGCRQPHAASQPLHAGITRSRSSEVHPHTAINSATQHLTYTPIHRSRATHLISVHGDAHAATPRGHLGVHAPLGYLLAVLDQLGHELDGGAVLAVPPVCEQVQAYPLDSLLGCLQHGVWGI